MDIRPGGRMALIIPMIDVTALIKFIVLASWEYGLHENTSCMFMWVQHNDNYIT